MAVALDPLEDLADRLAPDVAVQGEVPAEITGFGVQIAKSGQTREVCRDRQLANACQRTQQS